MKFFFSTKLYEYKIIVYIFAIFFFTLYTPVHATNFSQSSWLGGVDTVSTSTDVSNQSNWTKYYSQSNFSANSTVSLASTTYVFTDDGATSTSPVFGVNGGGFGNGIFSSTAVNGSGAGASIGILGSPLAVGVKKIAGGFRHTCVLKVDGSVFCMGYNGYGQIGNGSSGDTVSTPTQVVGLTSGTVKDIAAGWDNTCAVKIDGSLVCWGANFSGQSGTNTGTGNVLVPTQVYGLTAGSVSSVSVGTVGTCAVKTDGSAWCWGSNANGKVGDNTTTVRATPTQVSGFTAGTVSKIVTTQYHACALKTDGSAWCWGWGSAGILGNGTTNSSYVPVQVSGLAAGTVKDISIGDYHSCALKVDGSVVCWGNNASGELGDSTTIDKYTPTQVSGLTSGTVIKIEVGFDSTCALLNNGTVKCWGIGAIGQIGDGAASNRNSPVFVTGLSSAGSVRDISAGAYHYCVIKNDGAVACWGDHSSGIPVFDGQLVPIAITGLSSGAGQLQIANGEQITCAVKADGSAWCWGNNDTGQLGDNTYVNKQSPVQVYGLGVGTTKQITAGMGGACALKTNGSVLCWGQNTGGSLGDGTYTNSPVPVQVSGLGSGVVKIDSRSWHTCALKSDSSLVCWGDNISGGFGDNTTVSKNVPTQVSGLTAGTVKDFSTSQSNTCAVKVDGSAWCWGSNYYGKIGDNTTTARLVPTQVSGLTAGTSRIITAGRYHTCAVKTNGSAWCWGIDGTYGEYLGDDNSMIDKWTPVQVTGLTAGTTVDISATYHTCAIKSDGSLLCWGWNTAGSVGDNTTVDQYLPTQVSGLTQGTITSVTTNYSHTCGIKADGAAVCWGGNGGRLGDGTVTQRNIPTQVLTMLSPSGQSLYASSGVYTSTVIDLATSSIFSTVTYGTTLNSQTLTFKIRSSNSSNFSGAPAFSSCSNVTSGALLSSGGCVTNGHRYIQYQASLSTSDTAVTPTLDSVVINFIQYNSTGNLVSSVYDSMSTSNSITKLSWTESATTTSEVVKFQLRSSPNGNTWTNWCGPAIACTGSDYFTYLDNGISLNSSHPLITGGDDRYFQYKAVLIANSVATPNLTQVIVQYVNLSPPTISSPVSSSVGIATSTLGATITSNGGSPITARGTCYSTTNGNATLALGTCVAEGGTSVSSFTHARTGLSAGTTYYYQGYATNAYGTTYSGQSSFTTQSVPVINTPTYASVANVSATLGATLVSTGSTTITARGTCYATTANPVTNCAPQGSVTTGVYTQSRSGLTADTLYYYRGYTTYTDGSGYSSTVYTLDDSFTTPTVPSISSPVSSLTGINGVTLGATITSNGGSPLTARGTCYSTTNGNATLALGTCVAEGGTSVSSFTHARTGLSAGTTYYFQGYATNAYGTIYSGQSSFTTQTIPTVTSPTSSSVINVSATLGANLTGTGGTTITARGTCYATTANPVTNCIAEGATSTGAYTHSRTSLTPGTAYYYRGYASYTDGAGVTGTAYSIDGTFTTPTVSTVTSSTYASLTDTTVTLGATITTNGGSSITSRGTCWGNTPAPVTNCFPEGATTTALFTQARTGLPQGTFIYARGYATNVYGTAYSPDTTFTTYAPPTVTSPVVSSVTNVGATLGATITSDGGSTILARGTCFGTTSSPVTNCVPEGGTSVSSFTHTRLGMTPGTLTYYRGYATNAYGTSYSADSSTTTLPNLTDVTVTPGNTQARVDYMTTSAPNTYSVLVLRSTSPVTDIPVNNTSYNVGDTIGSATVACIDTSILPGLPDSCIVNGLTNTVPYYFAVFTKETIGGAYSGAITPDGNPSTPDINATLVNLASYRVRNDDGGEATASYNVNENTPVTTDFLLGDKLRARFVLENQKTVLTNKSYQLEYATGSCTTFYQVPRPNNVTSEHWRMEPSPYLADNTITTHSAGVSIPSGKNFKPGRAQTFNNTTLPIVLKNNEYTEVEYSLRSTGSLSPYIPYCFRLTGTGDSSDFVYSQVLHVLPFSSIYRREAGGGGGGGAAAANTAIEAPTSVATTSTTGGTINSEILPSTTIENVITPSIQQSTTTPTRRRGGGGSIGLLNNQSTLIALTSPTGMVLGDTSPSMCTNMKSRMLYGSTDLTTGGEVSQLQYYLMQKGYLTRTQVTGNYLSATEKAVRAYQQDHHLIVTGIVGKVTREGMREEGCRR